MVRILEEKTGSRPSVRPCGNVPKIVCKLIFLYPSRSFIRRSVRPGHMYVAEVAKDYRGSMFRSGSPSLETGGKRPGFKTVRGVHASHELLRNRPATGRQHHVHSMRDGATVHA